MFSDIDFDLSRCIIAAVDRNQNNKPLIEKLLNDIISAVVENVHGDETVEVAKTKAEFLQELVLRLEQR